MTARNLKEVFNFVHKFLDLRKKGDNATLSLQCQEGKVTINLQLHLPSYPRPQYQSTPPPCLHPRYRPSPSRARRTARRAYARAEKANDDALIYSPRANTTEQVVASTTAQTNANYVHDETDKAFKEPTN